MFLSEAGPGGSLARSANEATGLFVIRLGCRGTLERSQSRQRYNGVTIQRHDDRAAEDRAAASA